jgi:hypothetical protein
VLGCDEKGGKFVKLPKIPMLLADLGPVPFQVTGAFGTRTIVCKPVKENTDANDAQQPDQRSDDLQVGD